VVVKSKFNGFSKMKVLTMTTRGFAKKIMDGNFNKINRLVFIGNKNSNLLTFSEMRFANFLGLEKCKCFQEIII
jgi:hypothetical protein